MAELLGTATIRVDMDTTAAARAIRQFTTRGNSQLRTLQNRVNSVSRTLARVGDHTIAVTVDDRTSAGAAMVRTAIRDLQKLGPVRIPVQINDGTRRGARTVQTTVARLQRLGPIRIGADIDVDPAAAAAAAAALRDLQQAARGAARALGTLATRATTATAALAALGAAARSLRGDMDDLDGSIRRTGDGMNGLRGRLGTVSTAASNASSAMGGLVQTALLLSPALIPIAVQAAPIAASLTAATVALGAFGAAAAGQISHLSEVAEAEKKHKEAIDEHGSTSKQAADAQAAWLRQVEKLPPQTRVAAAALSSLKHQYREWSDALAFNTMPVVTRSFHLFGAVFPKLTPLVKGASTQLMRFQDIAAGGITSPGFDEFMTNFTEFSTGVMSRANDALVRFTRTLNTGKISGGTSAFMEYVRENGPLVRETLSNVAQAIGNLLEGAANVGPGLLTVVNALAGLVAAVPPGAITTMLQLALAIKAVNLAVAASAAASARATAFATAIGAMRTAAAGATGVLPRLAAAISTMSRATKVAVAGTGIGLLVIALTELAQRGRQAPPDVDKLTSSLQRLGATGKVTGEAAKHFGTDLDGLYDKVRSLTDPSTTDKVQQFLVGWTGWDSTPVKEAKENLDSVDKALANLVKDGRADLAAAALKRLTAEYGKGGRDTKEFTKNLDDYKAAVEDAKFEQKLAADAMGLFGDQAQKTAGKLNEQKASADGLRQAIQALNDVNRAGLSGMIGFEAAIDAASKAAQENAGVLSMQGGQLVLNTEKQRNAAQALNDLAAKTDEAAAAARENGQSWSSVNGIYERGRQQLVASAMQMGLTRQEAQALADQILKIPDNKTAMFKADITDWKSKISEAEKQLKTAKGDKKAKLTADIADWRVKVAQAERQLVGAKASKQAKLTADIKVWNAKIEQAKAKLKSAPASKRAKLSADIRDLQSKVSRARSELATIRSKSVTVTAFLQYKGRSISAFSAGRMAKGGLVRGYAAGGRVRGYPGGGPISGPGTGTSDSVPIMASDGEFVINTASTRKYRPLIEAINDDRLSAMAAGGVAAGGMAGAGMAVGAGLAGGMRAATRSVESAARELASAVSSGVRDELQIASPSKKMKALAKDVGKGFISGLTGSRDKIKSVSKDLASDVRAAFSGRRESSLIKMINRDTGKLLSLASKRDSVTKKIADANKFATDTASQARSTGSLATIISEDHFSPRFVEGGMKASLNAIKKFTKNVQTLQKRGLSKSLLRQILEMGPEEGAAFAQSLVQADQATIKRFNSLQGQVSSASTKLGKVGADMLFDSGKHASKGFLTGLKTQQKDLEKLMLSIAKAMQKSIKKALGIRSPSTVFAEIGRNIGDGLVMGLGDAAPKVAAAAKKISSTAVESAKKTAPPKKSTAKAKPKTGFEAAVAELQRLVDTGKWKKKGSLLFEDISFQGMSKNFAAQQMKIADGFWAAVDEIKRAVKAGKMVFEDMTFKGMSASVLRFHDVIAQLWKGNPYGRNFGDFGNFGKYKQYGKYASGGLIVGPGSGTADRIPIMASNREFMMRAAAVDYYGAGTMAALNGMRIPRSVISQSVATSRAASGASVSHGDLHIHLTLENRGLIGSQMQMQDWLAKSLDNLARTNRLPATLRRP